MRVDFAKWEESHDGITPEEAEKIVENIIAAGNVDPEVAHADEDRFYRIILREVSHGKDMKNQAEIALRTQNVDFPRWCA